MKNIRFAVNLYCSPEFKEKIQLLAAQENRTVNNYILHVLEEKVKQTYPENSEQQVQAQPSSGSEVANEIPLQPEPSEGKAEQERKPPAVKHNLNF